MAGLLRVGCSGWDYAHWRARFHAAGVPRTRWLEGYATRFDTVELNNSFYRLPAPETFANWAARVPPGFVFAVKASRYLTHIKRLRDPDEPIHRLLAHAEHLGPALGPLLYQLPPRWMPDLHRLERFVAALPTWSPGLDVPRVGPLVHVIEFRHEHGVTDEVLELLRAHRVGVCLHDMPGGPTGAAARAVTSDTLYLRFHGATQKYAGRYGDAVLDGWADFLRPHLDAGRRVFAYFNNDIDAQAPEDAVRLRERLIAG
ncbi:hypothetical protein TBR22_A27900 [Luteitalea sp. TBR-22]|nr:hypothetical protein TBR22_A27900 [Luteitalea sp. TBR-22]